MGRNKDFQDFRGIDRLIDMMFGDEFAFMVLARPISQKKLERLRRDVFMAYQQLTAAPHMKYMETGEVSVHNTQIGSHRQSDGSSYARNQGEDRNEHGDLSHEVQHSRQQTAVSSSS